MNFTAKDVIRRAFGRVKNFMTPHALCYGFCGDFAYELAKGEGFSHETIYGVSVVEYKVLGNNVLGATNLRTDLSGCYGSKVLAEKAIDALADMKAGIKC